MKKINKRQGILDRIINIAECCKHGIDGRISIREREDWYLERFKEIYELAHELEK